MKDYLNEQLGVLLQTEGEASLYLNKQITVRMSSPREQNESLLDTVGQVDLSPVLSTETVQIFGGQTKINSQWYSVMEAHSGTAEGQRASASELIKRIRITEKPPPHAGRFFCPATPPYKSTHSKPPSGRYSSKRA